MCTIFSLFINSQNSPNILISFIIHKHLNVFNMLRTILNTVNILKTLNILNVFGIINILYIVFSELKVFFLLRYSIHSECSQIAM